MLDRTRLAIDLATEAGSFLREAVGIRRAVEYKSEVDLVTEVDRRSQDMIVDRIRRAFPLDAIVAEEDQVHERHEGPCWYIDPLDGTTNFVHGLPHFAVSIAFFDEGRPVSAVVFDPCKRELFHAERGSGAWLGETRMRVSEVDNLGRSLLVTGFPYDRKESAGLYLRYFEAFLLAGQDLRRYGSASLDLCYVAAGRFDGFWEWKLHPWDTAAGWLVLEEAGGLVSDFEGGAYDPWLPHILATNGSIHRQALDLLSELPRR